jgi:hypothetical protein
MSSSDASLADIVYGGGGGGRRGGREGGVGGGCVLCGVGAWLCTSTHLKIMRFLPKSAPPLPFNIHVPSSRNVLLFCTPSAFLLFSLTILAHMCLPVSRIMYLVM